MTSQKEHLIKSVAIIGAGPSGAITAAALDAENYFDRIRVFERRATPGGTWIYNPEPDHSILPRPGALPTELDTQLPIPDLQQDGNITTLPPNDRQRYDGTPIYDELTTNVPATVMSFSDSPFAYGPFAPHRIPRQYIENYFSTHRTDRFLSLNTTVEDVTKLEGHGGWKLTLRKYNVIKRVDDWWTETFDAVVLGNGHYNVPYIPEVKGLEAYIKAFPDRVQHSKSFRTGHEYENQRVLVIGNSASGHDVTTILHDHVRKPVYQSRRHPAPWDPIDGSYPEGVVFKPVITEILPSGRINFEDGTFLDDIDRVIYCTGYKASFPFWNSKANGGELWDYEQQRLPDLYLHTFLNAHPTVGFVGGLGLVLTFRSFEYQAIALARVFASRSRTFDSISLKEKEKWESDRLELVRKEGRKFHDVHPLQSFQAFLNGEGDAWDWLSQLADIAGLPTLGGDGRSPPPLGRDIRWALEHQRKYPVPSLAIRAPGSGQSDAWSRSLGEDLQLSHALLGSDFGSTLVSTGSSGLSTPVDILTTPDSPPESSPNARAKWVVVDRPTDDSSKV